MLKALGRRIRELRGEARLQQNELAALAKVSQATLSRMERGLTARHEEDTLERVAGALGRHLGWSQERMEAEIDTLRQLAGYVPKYGRVVQQGVDGTSIDDPWQQRLLEVYRRISPDRRQWLVEVVEVMASRPSAPDEPGKRAA